MFGRLMLAVAGMALLLLGFTNSAAAQDYSPTTTPPVTAVLEDGTVVITFTITVNLGGEIVTAQVTHAAGSDVAASYTLTGLEPGETYTLVMSIVQSLGSSGGDTGNSAARVPTNLSLPAQTVYSASATADANGNASFTIPMDGLTAATFQTTLSDSAGNSVVLETFTVTPADVAAAADAGTQPLAVTGSDSTLPMARIGAVLLGAGAVAVVVARKRRQTAAIDD